MMKTCYSWFAQDNRNGTNSANTCLPVVWQFSLPYSSVAAILADETDCPGSSRHASITRLFHMNLVNMIRR